MRIKVRLYLESLFFFFLSWGILNFKWHSFAYLKKESFLRACYYILRSNLLSTIMLLLALAGLYFIVYGLGKGLKTEPKAKIRKNLRVEKFSFALFIASYVVPSAAILLFGLYGKFFCLGYLAVLGVISVNTSLYYRNPVLSLLGYRIYTAGRENVSVLISEGEYTHDGDCHEFVSLPGNVTVSIDPEKSRRSFRENVASVCSTLTERITPTCVRGSRAVKKHPYAAGLLLSALIMVLMCAAGWVRWEGSDDFTVSQLYMGTGGEATPYVQVVSYFLGVFVIWLQRVLPVINWFSALEVLSVWVSFGIMEAFLLKNSKPRNIPAAVCFLLIFEPMFFLQLQYTRSAVLLTFAGLVLIYDAAVGRLLPESAPGQDGDAGEPAPGKGASRARRLVQALLGVVLFIAGTLFRYACWYVSLAYVGILIFVFGVMALKGKCLKQNGRGIALFCAAVIVACASGAVIYVQNQAIYNEWEQETGFKAYSKARADVSDYIPSSYTEEMASGDFEISYNDYFMLKCSVVNDQVFSKEYLEAVREKFDSLHLNEKTEEKTYNLKQALYYRSGRLSRERTLLITCAMIVLMAFAVGNRKNWLALGINILGTTVVIWYFLLGGRLPPWVADPVYLLAAYIAVLELCSFSDLGSTSKCKYPVRRYAVLAVLLICVCGRTKAVKYAIDLNWYSDDLTAAVHYIEESDGVYLLDNIGNSPYPYVDVYGALAYYSEGQWDNVIRVGNWDVGHPARNRQKEEQGVDSVIYSLIEGKSELLSVEGSVSFDMYRAFFKEHYGVDVEIVCRKAFGKYGIYDVVVVENETNA